MGRTDLDIDNKAHGYEMDLLIEKKARIDTYFGTINKIWVQKMWDQGLRPVTFDRRKGLKCRPPFVLIHLTIGRIDPCSDNTARD